MKHRHAGTDTDWNIGVDAREDMNNKRTDAQTRIDIDMDAGPDTDNGYRY